MVTDKLYNNKIIIRIRRYKVIKICIHDINLINRVYLHLLNNNHLYKLEPILNNKYIRNKLNNIHK